MYAQNAPHSEKYINARPVAGLNTISYCPLGRRLLTGWDWKQTEEARGILNSPRGLFVGRIEHKFYKKELGLRPEGI